jgi:molybdenum cofactor cytidylyltransferase
MAEPGQEAGRIPARQPGARAIDQPLQESPAQPPAAARLERFGCIILAAGSSSRMGKPKQLIQIGGRPLVVRAVEAALGSSVWPVIVVLGAHAEKVRPSLARLPVLAVENAAWPEGMASSIRTGITSLRQFARKLDGAIIALCDQPAFSADVISRLIAAQRQTGRSIAAAQYPGRCGAPALFMRTHFDALASLTGEEGARNLLNGDPGSVAAIEMPELAADLDTPEDVARFQSASKPPAPAMPGHPSPA